MPAATPRAKRPAKYRKVRDILAHEIATGILPEGGRIPTRTELVARFGVTRTTVERALADLRREGLIRGARRGGTRVTGARPRMRIAVVAPVVRDGVSEVGVDSASMQRTVQALLALDARRELRFLSEATHRADLGWLGEYDTVLWAYPDDGLLERLAEFRDRVILLNRYARGFRFAASDHRAYMQDLVEGLLDRCEASNPAVLYMDDGRTDLVGRERRKGFDEACAAHGVRGRIVRTTGSFSENLRALEAARVPKKSRLVLVAPRGETMGVALAHCRKTGRAWARGFLYGDCDNPHAESRFGLSTPTVLQNFEGIARAAFRAAHETTGRRRRQFVPHRILHMNREEGEAQ